MKKIKIKYCYECRKDTVHKLVAHESLAEGLGIVRLLIGIVTLGASETVGADWHYQCQCCGELTKE